MVKKLLGSVLLFSILVANLVLPSVASAQAWWAPSYEQFNEKVNDDSIPDSEIFGERYTHAQVWWVVYSLILFALDHDVSNCAGSTNANDGSINDFLGCIGVPQCDADTTENCISAENKNPNIPWSDTPKSLGFLELGRYADLMIQIRPASGVQYIASALNKVGVPTTYAQEGGFGFSTLSPVLGLWRASRDASYALVTLAVVVLAFMIMFRTKISPQASVTVQSAIPRLVIGLLLITFSYAIAGFVIDLSYLVLGIIAAVISQSTTSNANAVDVFNTINDVGGGIVRFGLLVIAAVFLGSLNLGALLSLGTSTILATGVILVIMIILVVLAIVRIFWLFLKTYVMVIMHVFALPFAALAYIASPSSNMFMSLLKSLIGHVSIYVTTAIVVMFAQIIVWLMGGGGAGLATDSFLNPYQIQPATSFNYFSGVVNAQQPGVVSLPGFSGVDVTFLALFVGVTVLLMAPSVANNIKSLIITGRPAREGFSMMGAGGAAAVGGFIGANIRQGAMGELGYKLGNFGLNLQNSESGFLRGVGRGFTQFGQRNAQAVSGKTTGAIREFRRGGDKAGTSYDEQAGN